MGSNRRLIRFLAISTLCLGAVAAVAGYYALSLSSKSTLPSKRTEDVNTVGGYFQPVLARIVESDHTGKIKGAEWTFTAYGTLLSWDGDLVVVSKDDQINTFRIPGGVEKTFTRWSKKTRTASPITRSDFSPGDDVTLSFHLHPDSGLISSVEITQNTN
jgi:hypothetical protein